MIAGVALGEDSVIHQDKKLVVSPVESGLAADRRDDVLSYAFDCLFHVCCKYKRRRWWPYYTQGMKGWMSKVFLLARTIESRVYGFFTLVRLFPVLAALGVGYLWWGVCRYGTLGAAVFRIRAGMLFKGMFMLRCFDNIRFGYD